MHQSTNRHSADVSARCFFRSALACACFGFGVLASGFLPSGTALAQDSAAPASAAASSEAATEKAAAAERLLNANNPREVMSDMAQKIAGQLPPDKRERYVDLMTSQDLVGRLREKSKTAMMKHFTADEMNALAEFYEKPLARSAMQKMGTYMADLLPFIQAETLRVVRELNRSPPGGNQ